MEPDAPDDLGLDPLIDALLEHLPPPGEVFLPADRALWLQIIGLAFQLIYLDKEPAPDGDQAQHN